MKLLILGAEGMLGQDLVKVFGADEKYQVTGWDRDETDISDEAQVKEKITKLAPEIIINAAAYNAVDKCEEPEGFKIAKKVNGLAIGHLAKTAKEIGAVLVHYSTDYVFDGEKREGYKEDDQPNPISKYGQTKLLGEQKLQKNTDKFYLIRTSRLFGPPGQGGKKSFFETMLELAKKQDKLMGVADEISCFTYTPDLAKATKEIIEKELDFGIYHVVNSGILSWYEALLELLDRAGIKKPVEPVPSSRFTRPAKRPKFSALINTKLPALRSYKEALEEFLKGIAL